MAIINVPAPQMVDRYNVQGFSNGFSRGIDDVLQAKLKQDMLKREEEKKRQEAEAMIQGMVQSLIQQGGPQGQGSFGLPIGPQSPMPGTMPAQLQTMLQGASSPQDVIQRVGLRRDIDAMQSAREAEKEIWIDPRTGETTRATPDQRQKMKEMGLIPWDGKEELEAIRNDQTGEVWTLPASRARRKVMGKNPWTTYSDLEDQKDFDRDIRKAEETARIGAKYRQSTDFQTFRADYKKEHPDASAVEVKQAWDNKASDVSPTDQINAIKLAALKRFIAGKASPAEIAAFNFEPDRLAQAAHLINNDARYINASADEKAEAMLEILETISGGRGGRQAGGSWRDYR